MYGLFWTDSAFLLQNFVSQSFPTEAAAGPDDYGNGSQEVAILLVGLDHQWLRHSH